MPEKGIRNAIPPLPWSSDRVAKLTALKRTDVWDALIGALPRSLRKRRRIHIYRQARITGFSCTYWKIEIE